MRPKIRVGDKFQGKHSGIVCTITWVDNPENTFQVKTDLGLGEEVAAEAFLEHWQPYEGSAFG